jgi:hypothetical protein
MTNDDHVEDEEVPGEKYLNAQAVSIIFCELSEFEQILMKFCCKRKKKKSRTTEIRFLNSLKYALFCLFPDDCQDLAAGEATNFLIVPLQSEKLRWA